nr:MAG TPA: hypothetical protein [Caudoviricetes sp.]
MRNNIFYECLFLNFESFYFHGHPDPICISTYSAYPIIHCFRGYTLN